MAFYMRNYDSEEKFDIAKFMNFENDVFDVLNSPFLSQISQLPIVEYYNVDEGFRDVDLISSEKYGTPFFAYLIQSNFEKFHIIQIEIYQIKEEFHLTHLKY